MGKKYPKLLYEGYDYIFCNKLKNKTRWRCTSFRYSCKSSLTTYESIVEVSHEHNHSPSVKVGRLKIVSKKIVLIKKNTFNC